MTDTYKGGKWSTRGIPGSNPDAPKDTPPPQVPANIRNRPLRLPPMVPIHEKAIEHQAALGLLLSDE